MAPSADELMAQGNEAYGAGDNAAALAAYESAIALAASGDAAATGMLHVLHSNASAAAARLDGKAQQALEHAQRAVALKPEWPKRYMRQAAAALLLHRPGDAERALREGLRKAPAEGEALLRPQLNKILEVGWGCCCSSGASEEQEGASGAP